MGSHHQGPHHDTKFPHYYWHETFYPFEFEIGRPKKIATKRKISLCKKCGKQRRTDGANDACVCKETGNTKAQAILFADERAKTAHSIAAKDLQDDIDLIEMHWAQTLAADPDAYYGEW